MVASALNLSGLPTPMLSTHSWDVIIECWARLFIDEISSCVSINPIIVGHVICPAFSAWIVRFEVRRLSRLLNIHVGICFTYSAELPNSLVLSVCRRALYKEREGN